MDDTRPIRKKIKSEREMRELRDRGELSQEEQDILRLKAENKNLREAISNLDIRVSRLEKAAIFIERGE